MSESMDSALMAAGWLHKQIYRAQAGLCSICLERYITGRVGGAPRWLVEEIIDGVSTGRWICPHGRPAYPDGALRGLWPYVF